MDGGCHLYAAQRSDAADNQPCEWLLWKHYSRLYWSSLSSKLIIGDESFAVSRPTWAAIMGDAHRPYRTTISGANSNAFFCRSRHLGVARFTTIDINSVHDGKA